MTGIITGDASGATSASRASITAVKCVWRHVKSRDGCINTIIDENPAEERVGSVGDNVHG